MTESLETTIRINNRDIAYRVVHSRRARRLRITVNGSNVVVTLPAGVKVIEAENMLRQHSAWLLKQLERSPKRKPEGFNLPKDIILLRGEPKRIEVVEEVNRKARTRVDELSDRLIIRVPAGTRGTPRQLALDWLKQQARATIEIETASLARQMGLRYTSIAIRDQRTRWGSCSSKGTLSFNWRLVMVPPTVMSYVIIHELAHLRQPDHSKAFWQIVAGYYPDYKLARAWMRKNTAALRPADIEPGR